jgi:hypothetical protein
MPKCYGWKHSCTRRKENVCLGVVLCFIRRWFFFFFFFWLRRVLLGIYSQSQFLDDEAIKVYEQALTIAEKKLGSNHPQTALYMKTIADVYRYARYSVVSVSFVYFSKQFFFSSSFLSVRCCYFPTFFVQNSYWLIFTLCLLLFHSHVLDCNLTLHVPSRCIAMRCLSIVRITATCTPP